MLNWLKERFTSKEKEPVWEVMERMDPLLSYQRFQALELSKRQRPIVKGLIDGTIKPAEIDAVRRWKDRHGEDDDGIDALVFALQHVLEGNKVTYVFEAGELFPAARFPRYVDRGRPTVLFSDRVNHLQIASLDEFLSSNNIQDFSLESLNLTQLRERITGGPFSRRTSGRASSKSRVSITIERQADAEEHLAEAVGAAEIALALNEAGYDVNPDDVCLEEQLETLGLHKVSVKLDEDSPTKCFVWVVPSADIGGADSI